ncbi:helix-turn-helix domain-containing protein [Duganella radicis]|nr:AraC family transcriptional regulator [Duganella radicis]
MLPMQDSPLPWRPVPGWNVRPGGPVALHIQDDPQRLRYEFDIAKSADPPFVAVDLAFRDRKGKPVQVDLSRYSALSLRVKCAPANTLSFSVFTFQRVVKGREYLNDRPSSAYFSCNKSESRVEIDLTRLETPHWWFLMVNLDLSRQAYKLDKVSKIAIGSTFQSPLGTPSAVEVSELELEGRDYRYLTALAVMLCLAWGGFGLWFFLRHTRVLTEDVRGRLQKDLPFVAYQQLSLEPHRDREKTAILQFIGSKYADPGLELDTVVEQTGVNRTKVGELLKAELGYTFSGYVNKLRLTEAARLLAEKESAAVAEIAYSVGYGNVSYFNKLFKEEYGCTPKAFRDACKRGGATVEEGMEQG